MRERYQLTAGARGERVLVIDMTLTDPAFYTRPVTGQKKWRQVPDGHLLPYDCAEEGWRTYLEGLERRAFSTHDDLPLLSRFVKERDGRGDGVFDLPDAADDGLFEHRGTGEDPHEPHPAVGSR